MPSHLPPLHALQAFEAVGRLGTAAAAARQLGVSPGAVSQHINRLEEIIGVALFERKGRSLVLTSWGQLYLERIGAGFDRLRSGQDLLQRARLQAGIVFSAPPSVSIRWLCPLMLHLQNQYPGLRIRLIGEDDDPVLEEKQVDFRISYGTARYQYAHFTDMFYDWVVPVCSPSFLAAHPVHSPGDILKGPLIGIEWKDAHVSPPSWLEWAAHFGVEPPHEPSELSFTLSSSAIDAAIAGGGFVLGQSSLIAPSLARGELVVACPNWLKFAEPYALAWNPASLDRPFGREFRSFILQEAQKLKRT